MTTLSASGGQQQQQQTGNQASTSSAPNANSSNQSLNSSTSTQSSSSPVLIDLPKKYSLVKWLENSQFDINNEWFGRLTSVPHSNIIDFDVEELKAGMEISVFRNGGEIWRAQVIIPKTASNTIDLPPSTHRISKIRTKAIVSSNKLTDSIEPMDTSTPTFVDLNDFTVDDDSSVPKVATLAPQNATLMLLTTPTTLLSSQTSNAIQLQPLEAQNSNSNKLNKELQFLQKAINDAGLTDFYQTVTQSSNEISLCTPSPLLSSSSSSSLLKSSNHSSQNQIQVSDVNIETILQMQCELLEQQKELKRIEFETIEKLRLLQQNLNRLVKKFESFENVVYNYTASQQPQFQQQQQQQIQQIQPNRQQIHLITTKNKNQKTTDKQQANANT